MSDERPRRAATLNEMTIEEVAEKVARAAGEVDVKYRSDGSARLTGPLLPLTIDWGPPKPPRRRRGPTAPPDDELRAEWDAAWKRIYDHPNQYCPEYRVIAGLMNTTVGTLYRWRRRLHLEPPAR